jgi:myo-inositol-1(or 4)-monophosphatase
MLAEEVMSIAREAGRMMVSADRIEVKDKGSKENHVTNMDVAVQEFLRKRLTELLPGSSFVGEENDYADRTGEYYWVVDPIDGTTNYIRNLQISVTSIGLVHDGEPVLGVVYCPFTDEMYHAEKGKGAYRNGVPIHVSDRDVSHSVFAT